MPQRDALQVAFGLQAGAVPDRFLVALAALDLLAAMAEREPLAIVVDDAQWLDEASCQALAFVARRLVAEPIVMVIATRGDADAFAGLPELRLTGLARADALALLADTGRVAVDERGA